MSKKIVGTYLHQDLTEIITETFARRYLVDLTQWVSAPAYYDEMQQLLLCNDRGVPDGTYIALGKVHYPCSLTRMNFYHTYQFNLAKCRGLELRWACQFRPYPNVPERIPLAPVFPMFRIGTCAEYLQAKDLYFTIMQQSLTKDYIKDIINQESGLTLKSKMYRLRLALQREIDKEK
jgi:hypothetical protein